jgi:O-antigen/teichoic acid export membrane protein
MPSTPPSLEAVLNERATIDEKATFFPARDRIQAWGMKSAVSLVDQTLTSAASFGVNVLLARWMSASQYGAFAVAFAGYLFLTGFHNALLLEPLIVIGPARHMEDLHAYFRTQLRVHGLLVCPLAGLALAVAAILFRFAPHSPLIAALVGGGLALPVLLLLWLARRMCYVLQQPWAAVVGSGVYCVFSIGGLSVLRHAGLTNPMVGFLVLGAGSLLGALMIFRQLAFTPGRVKDGPSIPLRLILREDWTYGRWLVGSTILYAISTYTQTFFVAGAIGLGAAGVLRAMQVPSLVMTQIIAATGLLVLPALSYDFGRGLKTALRRKAILVCLTLGTAALCFTLLLALGDTHVERLLYGGKYSGYARLIPILALIPAFNGLSTGYSMALRASQAPYFDLVSNAFAAPVAILSTVLFVRWWGLLGASASMVLSFGIMNLVIWIFFTRFVDRRSSAQ